MDEPEFTARPHTDLDGVVGWTEPVAVTVTITSPRVTSAVS